MSNSCIDSVLATACQSLADCCEKKRDCFEDAVRRSPAAAVAGAALAGYFVKFLPVTCLAGGVLKLLTSLLKPVLLLYGAAKVIEYLRQTCEAARTPSPLANEVIFPEQP